MPIQQVALAIPPEIQAGLLSGDFVRKGSVVRNLAGEIVKHLDEVPIPANDAAANANALAQRLPNMIKSPKAVGIGIGVAAAAGGVAYIVHRTRKSKAEEATAEQMRMQSAASRLLDDYADALNTYLIEAQDGSLTLASIDRLINSIEALKGGANGTDATIEISADKLTALIDVIRDYTERLASANDVSCDTHVNAQDSGLETIVELLDFQKHIFEQAA